MMHQLVRGVFELFGTGELEHGGESYFLFSFNTMVGCAFRCLLVLALAISSQKAKNAAELEDELEI
jgi:hypothetical protein